MKKFFTGFILLLCSFWLQAQSTVSGTVTNTAGEPLAGANVVIKNSFKGTQTTLEGRYTLRNLAAGDYEIMVSYLSYESMTKKVSVSNQTATLDFALASSAYVSDEITVLATRANDKTPTTFSNYDKEFIDKVNVGQDVPYLLEMTPSVVVTSDAGAGVGYTGIRVRGSDPTRVNVTINGIPLNDAESHGVFWVNMPDFSSSVDNIQIQRGVGTSTNGASAFGASLNLQTNSYNPEPYGEITTGAGSFNTLRNNIKLGSGLINDKFIFEGRLSRITSDGYVDRASSTLNSYYLSAGYYGDKSTLRLNMFSGHEVTYQAWWGLPQTFIETNRTYNPAGISKPGEPHDNEVDDYTQNHYQALYTYQFNNNWSANGALHYTKGFGFFEEYKADQDLIDYGIDDVVIGQETITTSDLIRRRWLDNDFYGLTYSLNYQNNKFDFLLGGGLNNYVGDHFGEVIWARFAGDSETEDRYYENQGIKKDFNIYTKGNYQFNDKLNGFVDLQVRGVTYEFDGFDQNGMSIRDTDALTFFNPKVGALYEISDESRIFASFAVGNKEPNRDDYTESSTNSRPSHETLYDTELGYQLKRNNWRLNANAYYMHYKNQLALNGQINDVGAYSRINIPNSYRAGLELESSLKIVDNLTWNVNATFSQNKVAEFTEYIDNWDTWGQEVVVHTNTDLAFSPNLIAASELTYSTLSNKLNFSLINKYVGKQYIDNTSNENAALDPYHVQDLRVRLKIETSIVKELNINFLIRNIFDAQYVSNAWIYRFQSEGYDPRPDDPYVDLDTGNQYNMIGLYPQAGRHFLVSLNLKF